MSNLHNRIALGVWDRIYAHRDTFAISGILGSLKYLPTYEFAELDVPQIPVAPNLEIRHPASRGRTEREYVVSVAPHVAASAAEGGEIDNAKVAKFSALMGEIMDVIESGEARDYAGASLIRLETQPLYDPELLASSSVLRGVVVARFKANVKAVTPSA